MPLVQDEQQIKNESTYPEYEKGDLGNELILKSNLWKMPFHYVPTGAKGKYVAHHDQDCYFCKQGLPVRNQFNYFVWMNGKTGVMDIKPSVFFDIQKFSKVFDKAPIITDGKPVYNSRKFSWMVIVSGEGKETRYTTTKNDNLAKEDYMTDQQLAENNEKLQKVMLNKEQTLENNYAELVAEKTGQTQTAVNVQDEYTSENIRTTQPQEKPAQAGAIVEDDEPAEDVPDDVEPDEIPF